MRPRPSPGPPVALLLSPTKRTCRLPPTACSPQRWLTSALLHQSFTHLLSNGLMIAAFGWQLERKYGPWRIALLSVLAALGGGLLRCAVRAGKGWRLVCRPSHGTRRQGDGQAQYGTLLDLQPCAPRRPPRAALSQSARAWQ